MQSHRISETRLQRVDGYLVAVLAVGLALATRLLLRRLVGFDAPLLPLALAVVGTTLYRGLGPGLVASLLCAVVWTRLFTNSVNLNFVILLTAGAIVCVLSNLIALERRRALESESVSTQQEKLIDLAHDAIIVRDADSTILKWNAGATATYGWTEAEAIGKVTHTFFRTRFPLPPGDVSAKLENDGFWEGELIHTCRSGAEIVVESRQVLLRDRIGAPVRILEINRECTDRKRAEEAMRRSESRFRSFSEANVIGVACGNLSGKIVEANEAFLRMTGYDRNDLQAGAVAWREIACASQGPFEKEFVRKDGSRIPVLVCATILETPGEEAVALMLDLSQRKALEQELQQKQKLETVGLLAAGVAHDFNNLLTRILMNAHLSLETLPTGHPAGARLEEVTRDTTRAARLTSQLLSYAGKGRMFVKRVDLTLIAREAASQAQSSVPKQIQMRLELAPNLPSIEGDAIQIQLLLTSLIVNAAEAIGENHAGEIVISTAICELGPKDKRRTSGFPEILPGAYVIIGVRDTGCGMDEATMAKVFDPFFTTKFLGRGLGLSAAQGIVRAHQGMIRIGSAPGNGANVEALFPMSAPPSDLAG
jgi:two-component system cell cycle sensor histidine kinase/response regulator CckA